MDAARAVLDEQGYVLAPGGGPTSIRTQWKLNGTRHPHRWSKVLVIGSTGGRPLRGASAAGALGHRGTHGLTPGMPAASAERASGGQRGRLQLRPGRALLSRQARVPPGPGRGVGDPPAPRAQFAATWRSRWTSISPATSAERRSPAHLQIERRGLSHRHRDHRLHAPSCAGPPRTAGHEVRTSRTGSCGRWTPGSAARPAAHPYLILERVSRLSVGMRWTKALRPPATAGSRPPPCPPACARNRAPADRPSSRYARLRLRWRSDASMPPQAPRSQTSMG